MVDIISVRGHETEDARILRTIFKGCSMLIAKNKQYFFDAQKYHDQVN
jgi:hypothetical protein